MNIKKITSLFIPVVVLVGALSLTFAGTMHMTVSAQDRDTGPINDNPVIPGDGGGDTDPGGDSGGGTDPGGDSGGEQNNPTETESIDTSTICDPDDPDVSCDCVVDRTNGQELDPDNCEIIGYIEVGINIMVGLAGMAIIGGLMASGYMYMTARDNPGQVQAARVRAVWAFVALLILIFFWGALQFLVPGGVL